MGAEARAMSYDFMMFKPVGEVKSPNDLSEETTAVIGSDAEIREALSRLYPEIDWQDDQFGSLNAPDGWYEFRLYDPNGKSFAICTSHRAVERPLISEICRALGLVAFDGQLVKLIHGED
jgi:hypothetical protein